MKPHVLILEDNFIISAEIAGLVTKTLNAIPVMARSVATAMKLIPHDIAVAFLDSDMLNGVSYPIAKNPIESEIPFIFVSGKNKQLLPVEFRESPFGSEPVSFGNLVQIAKLLASAFE